MRDLARRPSPPAGRAPGGQRGTSVL